MLAHDFRLTVTRMTQGIPVTGRRHMDREFEDLGRLVAQVDIGLDEVIPVALTVSGCEHRRSVCKTPLLEQMLREKPRGVLPRTHAPGLIPVEIEVECGAHGFLAEKIAGDCGRQAGVRSLMSYDSPLSQRRSKRSASRISSSSGFRTLARTTGSGGEAT